MRCVVITGVSTGIGRATTAALTKRGFHVFGGVRSQADAERLNDEFGANVTPLIFDVTDTASIASAAEVVRSWLCGAPLAGLVNNAGIAVSGPLIEVPADEFRRQLDVNVIGPFLVTQAFASLLGSSRDGNGPPGRIVNISSVSGKIADPFMGPYAASKFALEGMSESLRRELLLFGIKVIVIGPGMVKTPIWKKAEQTDLSMYAGSQYLPSFKLLLDRAVAQSRSGLPVEMLGEAVFKALTIRNPKARYAVVAGPLTNWFLPRLMPKWLLDRLTANALGFPIEKRQHPFA
jgi:NAD(P)-dependent dehydrogenase (short-subunit alcohol dehydrogenase family)